jgi:hypothetical protein
MKEMAIMPQARIARIAAGQFPDKTATTATRGGPQ